MELTMNKHTNGMIVYIIITFGMAWGIWGIALLSGLRPADGLVFQAAIFPGIFAPAVAAVIVRRWVTQEGFTSARLRPNLHRWKPYLLAWFLPLIVIAVVVLFAYGFNLSLPDYSLQRGYVEHTGAQAPEGFRFLHFLLLAVLAAPLMAPVMLGEEFGWRGYLQPRLSPGRPLFGALLTGLIWALWHLPLHLAGYHLYGSAPVLSTIPLLITYSVLLSILFGWLQQRADSVWAPALAHAAANMLGANLAAVLFAGGPNYVWLSYGGILSLIPLGLVCLYIVMSMQEKAGAVKTGQ
jgi:uncharacterized protein